MTFIGVLSTTLGDFRDADAVASTVLTAFAALFARFERTLPTVTRLPEWRPDA